MANTSEPEISKDRAIASLLRQFSLKVSPDHTKERFHTKGVQIVKMSNLRVPIAQIKLNFCINLYLFEYIHKFGILR